MERERVRGLYKGWGLYEDSFTGNMMKILLLLGFVAVALAEVARFDG